MRLYDRYRSSLARRRFLERSWSLMPEYPAPSTRAQAGEQIRSNGIISRLGEPAAHVPNPFMLAEYLVYDDQDRRVIVSLGTRPKAWPRNIAARNHNVFQIGREHV